jgi:hypothetical protein
MPYIDEERTIKTKVIGVNSKIDDGDDMKVRQVVLQEMADSPESVSMLYLKKREVWVMMNNGREHYLGDIKSKYQDMIMSNPTQIKSWQITGGHEIPAKIVTIAGEPTVQKQSIRAKRGMNIHVKLL